MKTRFNFRTKQGSALLIVLGFLSFMMVSAVSFAIFMRIDRQASSNFRHTMVARHMLNAALYRAIDEVDTDLRRQGNAQLKFPDEWPGRVRASAVEDPKENALEPRVLSMEALSYIPGILVNDVRRYAVWQDGDDAWMGAKWRPLSMPVGSLGDKDGNLSASENGQVTVGRYAYVCVNVSDMLNVNGCKGANRNTESNRVGITHLFSAQNPPTADTSAFQKGLAFDQKVAADDKVYETLQDFYACMDSRRGDSAAKDVNTPKSDSPFGSPYHVWQGKSGSSADGGFGSTAGRQVLIADGFAKAEPFKDADSVNIRDAAYRDPNNLAPLVDACSKKLATIVSGDYENSYSHFYYSLMDYLDTDNTPYFGNGTRVNSIYRPSLEMVPMIYQLIMQSDFPKPTITSRPVGEGNIYTLNMTGGNSFAITAECMFPFKNWEKRKAKDPSAFNFSIDASGYMVAFADSELTSGDSTSSRFTQLLNLVNNKRAVQLQLSGAGGGAITPLPGNENTLTTPCPLVFMPTKLDIVQTDKDGHATEWFNTFSAGQKIRIAIILFVGIRNNKSEFVDLVPGYWTFNGVPKNWAQIINSSPTAGTGAEGCPDRLFFLSNVFTTISESPSVAGGFNYLWTSLETPDPVYNHRASNWFSGSKTDNEDGLTSATQSMLGQDGRDNSIYHFVSNGGRLYSPGEFGFLPRPIEDEDGFGDEVIFATQTAANQTQNKDSMFRTLRLYDHGATSGAEYKHDPIFSSFCAKDSNGILPGARVNPLSDLPIVLQAAIQNTPFDYYYANLTNTTDDVFFNDKWSPSWSTSFINAWTTSVARIQSPLNTAFKNQLSSLYCDWDYMKWYDKDTKKIFGTSIAKELDEVDRKMLYSFSMDSFSDRQQLFLYIIRAEATSTAASGLAGVGAQSLAGGRAVALVWRDPYPARYALDANGGESYASVRLSKDTAPSYSLQSPWAQYYHPNVAVPPDDSYRNELHDFRILYFKQFDN